MSDGCPFSIANIPFGIITTQGSQNYHPATAIGPYALDLAVFKKHGGFSEFPQIQQHLEVFSHPTLNAFASLGQSLHRLTRNYLQEVLSEKTAIPYILKDNEGLKHKALIPLENIQNHMPLFIRDYTDFYAGLNHAFNVGVLFRGPDNALQPNYKNLPVAYHGRASSVVISGTPIRRPAGQLLTDPTAVLKKPVHLPCKKLDFELELAAFIATGNDLGEPISTKNASESVFGYVLMNDWSARDIQAWEYVPLGPFNSKNFGTTISPWVVLPDALAPFKTAGLHNDVDILAYLKEDSSETVYDIKLEVEITTNTGVTTTLTKTNASNLLWSFPQMIAHHTVSGCSLSTGDLLASGTISGKQSQSHGSLLEMTENGKNIIVLPTGEERLFLEDGDTVNVKGWAGNDGENLVGFGDCKGLILPSGLVP